jgi:hypothetical protein
MLSAVGLSIAPVCIALQILKQMLNSLLVFMEPWIYIIAKNVYN